MNVSLFNESVISDGKTETPLIASEDTALLGTGTDLWGATLTPAIINGSTFGINITVYDTGNTTESVPLILTGFGFAIPSEATIQGVVVGVEYYQDGTNIYIDSVSVKVHYQV